MAGKAGRVEAQKGELKEKEKRLPSPPEALWDVHGADSHTWRKSQKPGARSGWTGVGGGEKCVGGGCLGTAALSESAAGCPAVKGGARWVSRQEKVRTSCDAQGPLHLSATTWNRDDLQEVMAAL